jgi:hypothetical protein
MKDEGAARSAAQALWKLAPTLPHTEAVGNCPHCNAVFLSDWVLREVLGPEPERDKPPGPSDPPRKECIHGSWPAMSSGCRECHASRTAALEESTARLGAFVQRRAMATLKYTVDVERPCAVCPEPLRAGELCYRDVGPEDFRHIAHGPIPKSSLKSYDSAPSVGQQESELRAYVQHKPECDVAKLEKWPRCTCGHSQQSHTFAGRDKPPYCRFCSCRVFTSASADCTCGLSALLASPVAAAPAWQEYVQHKHGCGANLCAECGFSRLNCQGLHGAMEWTPQRCTCGLAELLAPAVVGRP